jgi:hypothetical protein
MAADYTAPASLCRFCDGDSAGGMVGKRPRIGPAIDKETLR